MCTSSDMLDLVHTRWQELIIKYIWTLLAICQTQTLLKIKLHKQTTNLLSLSRAGKRMHGSISLYSNLHTDAVDVNSPRSIDNSKMQKKIRNWCISSTYYLCVYDPNKLTRIWWSYTCFCALTSNLPPRPFLHLPSKSSISSRLPNKVFSHHFTKRTTHPSVS